MRKPTARLLCAVGALLLMAGGAYALTTGDSLITLSYLKDTFLPSALQQGETAASQALQETYDQNKEVLDRLQAGYLPGEEGGSYSQTLQLQDWSDGDAVELSTGAGILMGEGTVSLTHNGVVIDVTEGTEVASGVSLTLNHRYLVGEDTQATLTALSGAARLGVQGGYIVTEGSGKATPFYDVSQNDWFYAPASYAYEKGLFSGLDEHHFAPKVAMDRSMMMRVLYQLAGGPKEELEAADVRFDDVDDTAWYAPYVKWGADQGITAGTGPNLFSPKEQVTRQQVVALLYNFASRYLGLPTEGRGDLSVYEDVDQAASWALNALGWAVDAGVISSADTDRLILNPKAPANRAEVATMLRTFAEKVL